MDENTDKEALIKKSKRAGVLAIVFFFLAALLWSVNPFFLWAFGGCGSYFAFLWMYNARQASPEKPSFQHTHTTRPPSWQNPKGQLDLRSKRITYFVIGSVLIFIFLIALSIFSTDSESEDLLVDDTSEPSEETIPEREDYIRILQRDPNNIDALTNAGNSFYDNEQYDSAIGYYNRVLALDASNGPAIYNKGLVFYNQKNFQGAAELASRCVQIDPSNTDALLLLGDAYNGQNSVDLALIQYTKAYELGTRTPGLSNMLGYIHDTKGNTGKAISFYKETLQQDSSLTDVYTRLAELEPTRKIWYEQKAEEWKAK